MKKIYNAMAYRSGMPDDAGLIGCERIQTCNRGFYGKDANGNEVGNVPPNWANTDKLLATFDKTKPIYFDLETWFCNPTDPLEILNQKLWAGELLAKYKKLNPKGLVTLFGFPTQAMHPLNPQKMTDDWRAKATETMSGGELSNLVMANIDALGPSFYPSEYTGNDDPYGSWETQLKFNELCLDLMKANNPRNLPIYGWFQPRMQYRGDGLRHFLDYKTTFANVDWILNNCDGMVLWEWDGYGDPDGENVSKSGVAPWNTNMPWYQAVHDLVNKKYNMPPIISTSTVNSQTPIIPRTTH